MKMGFITFPPSYTRIIKKKTSQQYRCHYHWRPLLVRLSFTRCFYWLLIWSVSRSQPTRCVCAHTTSDDDHITTYCNPSCFVCNQDVRHAILWYGHAAVPTVERNGRRAIKREVGPKVERRATSDERTCCARSRVKTLATMTAVMFFFSFLNTVYTRHVF